MAAEYERIRARSREDPGTAGDEGEQNWAELLRRWLPATYHVVTKGRILFTNGTLSPQVDVLVLSPGYPRGLLDKKVYLAPGVLAGFECKNTLRLAHIKRAIQAAVKIRQGLRSDVKSQHNILFALVSHSHAVLSKQPEQSITGALTRVDADIVADPRDCIDFICVADLGTWALMRMATRREDGGYEVATVYMAPIDETMQLGHRSTNPPPIGRFLTGLLRRLGSIDPALAPMATYFGGVGLFGTGYGSPRKWEYADLPADLGPPVF